jgi:hypothetical protein
MIAMTRSVPLIHHVNQDVFQYETSIDSAGPSRS